VGRQLLSQEEIPAEGWDPAADAEIHLKSSGSTSLAIRHAIVDTDVRAQGRQIFLR
jgi:hypothetical protein